MIHIKSFGFSPFSVNTYVLWDNSGEAVVIDCACSSSNEEEMLSGFIAENKLNVKYLLNTHLHFDHLFGNHYFYKRYGIKTAAHCDDVEHLPLSVQRAFAYGINIPDPGYEIEMFLSDGDVIRFGNSELLVKHIPGHSPGSLVFYAPKADFVISGDVLFQQSIGRTDLWGGNLQLLLQGIREKLFTLPDTTVVYPGHGSATTIGDEKQHNPFVK